MARQANSARFEREDHGPLARAWTRFEHAAKALDEADEAEDFQAVGMLARECLLAFVKATAPDLQVQDERPKAADFTAWADLIAAEWAPGSSRAAERAYLRTTATATWRHANWLTHASGARYEDSSLAIEATAAVLTAYQLAQMKTSRPTVPTCDECGSYRVSSEYDVDTDSSWPICLRCDWHGPVEKHKEREPRSKEVDTETAASITTPSSETESGS